MQTASIIPAAAARTAALPLRLAAFAATLAALGLLSWVVAYWGWQLFGPAQVRIPAAAPADPATALLAANLFGGSSTAPTAAAADAAPQVLAGDVRLLGVFAEAQGKGYALFRLPAGPKLVAAGAEIAPGATLTAVTADGIRVRETGGERTIALRAPRERAVPVAAGAASTNAAVARNACAPPAGFKGQVVTLNVELMGGMIAQPEGVRALVEPANGALVVRDDSGFAAMLGLKRGDRITQANGIALMNPDDIVGAVLRPLASKQTVRLTGTRDGQTRELWLQNAGC